MTDKQIIIDGVDVSGCVNFRPDADTAEISYTNACFIGLMQRWYSNLEPSCIMSCSCKYNPDCHYKQLKRKEQECEELKKQLENTKGLVTVGNRQLAEALEGYNDLKNELHSKVDFIQEQRNVIDEYSKEIEMYKKCQGSRASKREEKLKQTLAEIKEIAEEKAKVGDWLALDILQKINEREGQ